MVTGSSYLLDVALINDTLGFAVGVIYQSSTAYNAAKWNGSAWTILNIPYYYQGQVYYTPIYSVLAFAPNDIWFESGVHWDGNQFNSFPPTIDFPSHVNRMWGTSSKDFYIVGNSGLLAHYNGNTWTKIASGITLDIRDLYGAQKAGTGSPEIYAAAGNPLISPEAGVIQITGMTAQAISVAGIGGGLNGLWFSPGQYYWVVGDGEWQKHPSLGDATWHSQTLSSYTIDAVNGNGTNDVFMCGAYGELLHFNGASWKSYQSKTGVSGPFTAMAVRGNTVMAVGEANGLAVITIGRR